MPRRNPDLPVALARVARVAAEQGGLCTAEQALEGGLSRSAIARLVQRGQWTRLHRGVYQTEPGSPSPEARLWAAHLALGPGSVIAGLAAGHLWGILEGQLASGAPIDVLLPERQRLRATGVRVRRVPCPSDWAHPARRPPVLTLEHTVLELVRLAPTEADAVSAIMAACRQRLTTPDRIVAAMATRARIRRRELVVRVCTQVRGGAASPLELEYRVKVAAPHGLPAATAQARSAGWAGSTVYRDLWYDPYAVVVELDGRLGHEREADVFRDQYRDNAATLSGEATLRFGWVAVAGHPCEVAGQVAALLALRGWQGQPHACREGCPAPGSVQVDAA